jgi:hypothetical protein
MWTRTTKRYAEPSSSWRSIAPRFRFSECFVDSRCCHYCSRLGSECADTAHRAAASAPGQLVALLRAMDGDGDGNLGIIDLVKAAQDKMEVSNCCVVLGFRPRVGLHCVRGFACALLSPLTSPSHSLSPSG